LDTPSIFNLYQFKLMRDASPLARGEIVMFFIKEQKNTFFGRVLEVWQESVFIRNRYGTKLFIPNTNIIRSIN
jgi:hypothetical protein